MPDVIVHGGIRPFTNYTVQLQACTTFGCGRSDLVTTRTLEAAPFGLAPPVVNITGSTSADISWGLYLKCFVLNNILPIFFYRFSTTTEWHYHRISGLSTSAKAVSI